MKVNEISGDNLSD